MGPHIVQVGGLIVNFQWSFLILVMADHDMDSW